MAVSSQISLAMIHGRSASGGSIMLAGMTEEDWATVLRVLAASKPWGDPSCRFRLPGQDRVLSNDPFGHRRRMQHEAVLRDHGACVYSAR
jgi:hypothetical protein